MITQIDHIEVIVRDAREGRSNIRLRDPDGWRFQIFDAKRNVERLTK